MGFQRGINRDDQSLGNISAVIFAGQRDRQEGFERVAGVTFSARTETVPSPDHEKSGSVANLPADRVGAGRVNFRRRKIADDDCVESLADRRQRLGRVDVDDGVIQVKEGLSEIFGRASRAFAQKKNVQIYLVTRREPTTRASMPDRENVRKESSGEQTMGSPLRLNDVLRMAETPDAWPNRRIRS